MKKKRPQEKAERPDYRKITLTRKETILCLLEYVLLDGTVNFLFYNSWIPFVLFLPGSLLYKKMKQEDGRQKRLHRLEGQFLTGMQAVSNALAAGYSVEYAFVAAEGEVKKTGELELIAEEFSWIVRQLSFHQPLESLLEDLAFRSGLEDIGNFAELFAVAKKSGGDLIAIIRNTISSISQKEETRGEIRVCISSKKLEQKIMSLVPLLILAYVRLASPGFLDVMYHNVAGIAIMSGCLAVYAFAWFLGKRIAEIEV